MNKIFRCLLMIPGLLAATSGSAFAENVETPSLLKVESIDIQHTDSILKISFDLSPARVKPGRDRQVVFTPVVRSLETAAGDSVILDPVTIAGRNRYYTHLRNGDLDAGDLILRAGTKGTVEYSRAVPWQSWMENSYIYMREETQDCCRPVKPLCDTPIAQVGTIAPMTMKTTNSNAYVALTGESAVELEAQGSAFVDFIVNRTEIRDNYRKNPEELKKIIESIDIIRANPDAVITRVSIKGFASPEGSYENNVRLAMGRTDALKEYVRNLYNFDPEIMASDYEPEDWDGLRAWLLANEIPNRDAILQIVNSGMAPDPKDAAIKSRFPEQYAYLLKNVYPALRHSDYSVRYRIKTYVDVEELKRIYGENPKHLRPVDFYRIAETYPAGSPQAEEVLLTASEVYPHDAEASINAANILMRRGKMQEAAEKLVNAGESGEAYFSRGMLALENEDFDRAEFFFTKARDLGMTQAVPFLSRLSQNKNRESIIYLIEPETTPLR